MEPGKRVQAQFIGVGIECDVFIGSAPVDMYAKYGRVEDALYGFDRLPQRYVISWTDSYDCRICANGCVLKALWLFHDL
jgi:hypothetical protein